MFVVNSPVCVVCGHHSLFLLSDEERAALNSGKLMQDALPDWTADERELMISGTHAFCWNRTFGCDDCNQADLFCDHNEIMNTFGGKR